MNWFDFGPDNKVYVPFSMEEIIVKVDFNTKVETVISNTFLDIESDNYKQNLYVFDTGYNTIYKVTKVRN